MKFITVATDPQHYYYSMIESAKRNNIDLEILGWGKKWGGFIWRLKLLINYLQNLDKNEIVMFVDAYDIIFMKGPQEIENEFLSYDKNIVFGGLCGENSYLEKKMTKLIFSKNLEFPEQETCFKALNAGCYIGYADSILDILTGICSRNDCRNKKLDDQKIISEYFIKNHHNKNLGIDFNTRIVYNFESPSDFNYIYNHIIRFFNLKTIDYGLENKLFKLENNNFLVKQNGTYPCIIHAHGYTNIDSIVKKLNLPPKIKSKNYEYGYQTFINTKKVSTILLIILLIIIISLSIKFIKSKKLKLRKKK
jgi:hypothetical protein